MKKTNRIFSLIISAVMGLSAVPVISNADYTEYTLPYESPDLSCYIDGNSVVFGYEKNYNYDFVTATAPDGKFKTERNDDYFTFMPEQEGTYIVSKVWLEKTTIYYPVEIFYDLMEGITAPAGYGYINEQCDYYYPCIQNFEITYSSKTGTEVKLMGERNYINHSNASDIASISSSGKKEEKFIEMETDEIFNNADYYTLASGVSGMPFIYFDYADENKKDKSVFCIKNNYAWDNADGAVSVTGNAEKTDTFCGGSCISGDLNEKTGDVVFYTLVEPTGDGLVEVYYDSNYGNPCDVFIPPVTMILNVKNGQFIPHIDTIGDDIMLGDMNFDYDINIADAVLMQKYMLGTTKLTSMQFHCADMNYDGFVDIFDMVLCKRAIINGPEYCLAN